MSDPFIEDADALIARLQKDNARLRLLEAKVKELLTLIGTSDATIDLNVPLAFRELKATLIPALKVGYLSDKMVKKTMYTETAKTKLRDLGAEYGMEPIKQ